MDLTAGTRVADRYVVERPIAKGGLGTVYVALDERLRVRVALKVTAAGGTAAAALQARFTREARIGHMLGRCGAGFVRVTDVGRLADDVQLFLSMDLIEDAVPLDLRSGTREERLARWRLAAELVRLAHEQGVIHRDLKPANFLQAPNGSIYLTDFGLAKIVGEHEEEAGLAGSLQTAVGHSFGTPPYMPPEQLEDVKHADQRADVFALGCMLFEALTGRLPYPGPSPTAIVTAHTKVRLGALPPPRPRDVDASVAEGLDQACVHALELDVGKRAASVAAVLGVLDAPPRAAEPRRPASPRAAPRRPTPPGQAPGRAPSPPPPPVPARGLAAPPPDLAPGRATPPRVPRRGEPSSAGTPSNRNAAVVPPSTPWPLFAPEPPPPGIGRTLSVVIVLTVVIAPIFVVAVHLRFRAPPQLARPGAEASTEPPRTTVATTRQPPPSTTTESPTGTATVRPYENPTRAWARGALKAGVRDPAILVDAGWTPAQKASWAKQFNALVAELDATEQKQFNAFVAELDAMEQEQRGARASPAAAAGWAVAVAVALAVALAVAVARARGAPARG